MDQTRTEYAKEDRGFALAFKRDSSELCPGVFRTPLKVKVLRAPQDPPKTGTQNRDLILVERNTNTINTMPLEPSETS